MAFGQIVGFALVPEGNYRAEMYSSGTLNACGLRPIETRIWWVASPMRRLAE